MSEMFACELMLELKLNEAMLSGILNPFYLALEQESHQENNHL